MTIKPMTYLISFTLFVLSFMGLGGYFGYTKIADHVLTQSYLDALPVNLHLQGDQQGKVLRWEARLPLQGGVFASISASNRSQFVSIQYSDEPEATVKTAPTKAGLSLVANERLEDVRVDKAGRFLYVRVFAASGIKEKESTWLYEYHLLGRKVLRRTPVNPILLPVPFRP